MNINNYNDNTSNNNKEYISLFCLAYTNTEIK